MLHHSVTEQCGYMFFPLEFLIKECCEVLVNLQKVQLYCIVYTRCKNDNSLHICSFVSGLNKLISKFNDSLLD